MTTLFSSSSSPWRPLRRSTAPDAGDDLFGVKGLYHVVVGAQLQAQHLVEHLALGGEHDDRGMEDFFRISRHTCQPSRPGSMMSSKTKSGFTESNIFKRGFAVVGDGGFVSLLF